MLNQIGEATWILEMVGDDTFLGSAEDTTSLQLQKEYIKKFHETDSL